VHEYGLVQSLLEQVDRQVRSHRARRALRVVLAIDGGHVDKDFLRDAFDTFKLESTARDAELIVRQAAVEFWCPVCGERAASPTGDATCPECSAARVPLASKDEIYLQSVEIEV
jgi:hydrogenase nickel insertion protein HypA